MSEKQLIPFYRGLKASYVESTHGNGIYFAKDTKEILMGGVSYTGALADGKVVRNITLAEDGASFIITYTDATTSTIEISDGKYASAIEDKELAMPNAVGGIAKGTKLEALEGKSYNAIFDDLLFPTVNPTFTAPSATIKFNNYSSTQEVGATAPTASNFSVSYNAGQITLNGAKQANRGGAHDTDNSFIYYNNDANNTTLPTVVALGNTSYKYRAAYGEGPQPKDNKGNDYNYPLPASTVDSSAVTVNGTYPWFASTSTATSENPVVKQALVAWNATAGSMSTGNFSLQPSGTLPQVFKLPRQCKTLQMLNTVSGQMDTIGFTDYNETTEVITIGSTDVTYYVYTYKGATRGEVTLLAKF